jgi:hypothetical protein
MFFRKGGDLMKSIKELAENPGFLSELLYHEGIMAFRQGEVEEAKKRLEAAIEADPQNNNAKVALNKINSVA